VKTVMSLQVPSKTKNVLQCLSEYQLLGGGGGGKKKVLLCGGEGRL